MISRVSKYLLIVLFMPVLLYGQESNLEKFTPAVIFSQGDWDIRLFTSIYSQSNVSDRNGNVQGLGHRATFLNTILDANIGLKSRWNIGLELHFNRTGIDVNEGSSLNILSGKDNIQFRNGFSYLGPKVRWQPIGKLPTLSLQSTLLIPISQNLETPIFLNHDRYNWYTQVFYDHAFSSKFRTFVDVGVLLRINRDSDTEGNITRFPASLFINYFPSSILNLYGFIQYSPRYGTLSNATQSVFGLTSWFTQAGGGLKVQVSQKVNLELSYARVIWSRNDGLGHNINFGIRYINRK